VLCSLAILLEITANLYVHRRGTRYSKRGQARRQQGIPQAARQSAGSKAERKEEKERQHWLRIHKRASKVCGKRSLSIQKRGRRGSGAGVSAGVAETRVRPFNRYACSCLLAMTPPPALCATTSIFYPPILTRWHVSAPSTNPSAAPISPVSPNCSPNSRISSTDCPTRP
jgi:hypothetical protein